MTRELPGLKSQLHSRYARHHQWAQAGRFTGTFAGSVLMQLLAGNPHAGRAVAQSAFAAALWTALRQRYRTAPQQIAFDAIDDARAQSRSAPTGDTTG